MKTVFPAKLQDRLRAERIYILFFIVTFIFVKEISLSVHPAATLKVTFAPPEPGEKSLCSYTSNSHSEQDSLLARPNFSHSRVSDIAIVKII